MGQRDEKDKMKTRKEKLAGYFYDLSKLIFTSMVLGGMSPLYTGDFKPYTVYVVFAGIIFTYITAFCANRTSCP
jgi:hypothetical protein